MHQGSILVPLQKDLQALLASPESGVSHWRAAGLFELLTVPGAALQEPDDRPQESPAQGNTLLRFTVAATGTKDRQSDSLSTTENYLKKYIFKVLRGPSCFKPCRIKKCHIYNTEPLHESMSPWQRLTDT